MLQAQLILKEFSSPDLDARLLLSSILKKPKEWIIANGKEELAESEASAFKALIDRRKKGEPIAYIIGHKEFYDLDFIVTPDVLIPRPETETLIDDVLEHIRHLSASLEAKKNQPSLLQPTTHNLQPNLDIADVGTGCGCIAITLAKQLPGANIWAFDISKKALSIARKNSLNCKANNIKFIENDLLSGVRQKFDIVCANLPYLDKDLKALLGSSRSDFAGLKFEPKLALSGGPDGLDLYRKLITQLKYILKPGGVFFCEIGTSKQAGNLIELIKKHLPAAKTEIKKDLAGLDRVVIAKL